MQGRIGPPAAISASKTWEISDTLNTSGRHAAAIHNTAVLFHFHRGVGAGTGVSRSLQRPISPWASAHWGKWGQLTPLLKNGLKIKKRKRAKKSSFLNILIAIRAGRCRERRYADHIFIQMYFRMHHFVVKFSKKIRLRRQGGIDP